MEERAPLIIKEGREGQMHLGADHALMHNFLYKPGFLLARIEQISTAIFGRMSDQITLSQAEFMLLLGRLGPMIQIALARVAGVDKSTTAYILDNLQARGLIERTVMAKDRRSSLVSLTTEGKVLLPEISHYFTELQRQLERPLGPVNAAQMVSQLYRLGLDSETAPLWRPACAPETGVLDTAISFLSRRVLQLLHAQFLAATQGTQLTLRQFSLLFILSRRDSLTQIEFARIFGVDPATCGVIMRGPTGRGLIESARSQQDKRAREYRITASGRELLMQVHPMVDQSAEKVFHFESEQSRMELVEHLRLIVMEYSELLRFPGAISGR